PNVLGAARSAAARQGQRALQRRTCVWLAGVVIGLLSVAAAAQPALAQAVAGQPAVPGTGLGDLVADPGKWATTMFNAALVGLGQKTTSEVVGSMGWLLGNGILVNTSLGLGHFIIDLNNALCQRIGATAIPAWDSVVQPGAGPALINLIAIAIYLVMGLLLLGQMLMRLALLDALLVIAPLALLCWVLPQTYSWARLWFSTFFGTVFVQSIQVLVLPLGAGLIQRLPSLLPALGLEPVENSRVWLVTLLLGVAVLQLARKVPR